MANLGEITALIASLPPWLQVGANVGLLAVLLVGGFFAIRKGHRDEDESDASGFDAAALLERSPIKAYLEAVQVMADHAKLQTEAAKTISAALVAIAKLVETDFDERRIQREVERRTAEMVNRRNQTV